MLACKQQTSLNKLNRGEGRRRKKEGGGGGGNAVSVYFLITFLSAGPVDASLFGVPFKVKLAFELLKSLTGRDG